jgi:hypothetical protein
VCTTSDTNDSSLARPEIEPWHEAINNKASETTKADLLHRTCTVFFWPHPNTGRSPVRPIAVVVYLIRPNRGLATVLLGKSTTTTKADPRGGISKRIQEISI